jgi:hypothetical protein
MWSHDVIDQRARHARLVDNAHPGPPWYFARAQGDVYRFAMVDVTPSAVAQAVTSPGAFLAALSAEVADALAGIATAPLSTSEALEAGERRRCFGR